MEFCTDCKFFQQNSVNEELGHCVKFNRERTEISLPVTPDCFEENSDD